MCDAEPGYYAIAVGVPSRPGQPTRTGVGAPLHHAERNAGARKHIAVAGCADKRIDVLCQSNRSGRMPERERWPRRWAAAGNEQHAGDGDDAPHAADPLTPAHCVLSSVLLAAAGSSIRDNFSQHIIRLPQQVVGKGDVCRPGVFDHLFRPRCSDDRRADVWLSEDPGQRKLR